MPKLFVVVVARLTSDNEAFYTNPAVEVASIKLITSSREAADAAAKKIDEAATLAGRAYYERGVVYEYEGEVT